MYQSTASIFDCSHSPSCQSLSFLAQHTVHVVSSPGSHSEPNLVDIRELVIVIDQHLQVPIVSSIHQRRGFSFRRDQQRDFVSEDHSVAVCHQHRHRQSRFRPIKNSELHSGCALDRRYVHINDALSIFIFTVYLTASAIAVSDVCAFHSAQSFVELWS